MIHDEERRQRKADMVDAARHVPRQLLSQEAKLLTSKWPAYRFMSPWAATKLYANVYSDQFYYAFGLRPDFEVEPESPAFLKLWRMRQAADMWAMPYDVFLELAFTMNRRTADPYKVPHGRFSNLHENESFKKKVAKSSRERASARYFDDMGPQYWVDAFRDLPSQVEFRDEAYDAVRTSGDWNGFARNLIVRRQYLPPEVPENEIDSRIKLKFAEGLARARADKSTRGLPDPGVSPHELWQSCHGVPGAQNQRVANCRSCPVSSACQEAGDIVKRAAAVPMHS